RAGTTPAGVPDRIPPRVDTPLQVMIEPDLTGSSQFVTLKTANVGAGNGDFTIDGNATSRIEQTRNVNFQGVVQTSPGSVGNLKCVAQVRGQDGAQSPGFSVAAMPIGLKEMFNTALDIPDPDPLQAKYGIETAIIVDSDSGVPDDLDFVDWKEFVEL